MYSFQTKLNITNVRFYNVRHRSDTRQPRHHFQKIFRNDILEMNTVDQTSSRKDFVILSRNRYAVVTGFGRINPFLALVIQQKVVRNELCEV